MVIPTAKVRVADEYFYLDSDELNLKFLISEKVRDIKEITHQEENYFEFITSDGLEDCVEVMDLLNKLPWKLEVTVRRFELA